MWGGKGSFMFPLDISAFFQPWAKKTLCITYVTKIIMIETKKVKNSMTEECTNRSVEWNRKARNSGTHIWDLYLVCLTSQISHERDCLQEMVLKQGLTILWWWLREVDNGFLPLTVIKTWMKKRDKYKSKIMEILENIQEFFVTQKSLQYIMPSKEYYKIMHII